MEPGQRNIMMGKFSRRLLLLGGIAAVGPCPSRAAQPVMILAAATLKNALDLVVRAAEAKLHVPIVTVYGPSPTLVKQLQNGAPGDIFFSADSDWMDNAIAHKLVDPASRVDLLSSRLVLVAPAGQAQQVAITPGFPLKRLLGTGRLAMCDPMMMPAGRYGRAALQQLDVWNNVKGHVAVAEDVLGALVLVLRREAALGIVFDTDARLDRGVSIIGTFPSDSHPPIVYPVAEVASGRNPNTRPVLEFIVSAESRAIFQGEGYTVLSSSH